jgi:hypothetical protein
MGALAERKICVEKAGYTGTGTASLALRIPIANFTPAKDTLGLILLRVSKGCTHRISVSDSDPHFIRI